MTFIKNFANLAGGGIDSSMSFIRLSSRESLLFRRNVAGGLGGGMYLNRNSKISINGAPRLDDEWALMIRYIHNTAEFYGGGVYIDDSFSCGATAIGQLQTKECFLRVESRNFQYLPFNFNEAKKSGSDLYGGIIDRCYTRFHADNVNNYTFLSRKPKLFDYYFITASSSMFL